MTSKLCSLVLMVLTSGFAVGAQNPSVTSFKASPAQARQTNGRQFHYISNRDSYADAANSFGHNTQGQQGQGSGGFGQQQNYMMTSSYQVPQNSYGVPTQSYGTSGGGWGADDDDDQSSKGGGVDLAGLVGLIGLKGLKGTIPLIKIATIALAALLPLLVPLTLFKLLILLFKPVITLGRGISSSSSSLSNVLLRRDNADAAKMAEKLSFLDFNSTSPEGKNWTSTSSSSSWSEDVYNEIVDTSMSIGNDILGKKDATDNQCMQRIACEGFFKSLPRIFLRIMGDASYPVVRRKRQDDNNNDNNGNDNVEEESRSEVSITARRKDLATLALNRLKNPQYLTKVSSMYDYKDSQEICRQYNCPTLS